MSVYFGPGLGSVGCRNEEWEGFVVDNGGLGISGRDGACMVYLLE